ncbi:MAG: hypothetical protein AAF449_10345 [Myxococcota bacterium]
MHLAALTTVVAATPAPTASASNVAKADFMKGVVVSCPGYGRVWGSPAMTQTLRTLKPLGVNWVQIHPYAGVRRDGRIRWQPAAETGYLPGAIRIAREEGVQLFWKPHLAYWGSFEWRGAITFSDDASWRRFFDGYRAFIVDQARFAQKNGVRLFSIGLEYHQTLKYEAEWRRIIKAVREVYKGRITYAANWDSLERVPFWDALDVIGVQAYFPLSKSRNPTFEDIRKGWTKPLATLNRLSKKFNKNFIFAEIGYSRSLDAATKPWEPATDSSDKAVANRRRLMEVALSRLSREPHLEGMFWWKWVPRAGFGDGDFSMMAPEATALLKRYWGASARKAPR